MSDDEQIVITLRALFTLFEGSGKRSEEQQRALYSLFASLYLEDEMIKRLETVFGEEE